MKAFVGMSEEDSFGSCFAGQENEKHWWEEG